MLKTTVVGSYPKISSDRNVPNLRTALNQFERKKISADELEEVYRATIKRIIKEQEDAGIDIITDGQIRWNDLLTPFAEKIEGCKINGLLRFFDNNFYYRKPVIKSQILFREYTTLGDYQYARKHSNRSLKAVLPGSLTWAKLSDNHHYKDPKNLIADFSLILQKEAKRLDQEGVEYIQFEEPSLCNFPREIDMVRESLKTITPGLKAKTILFLYFGSIRGLIPELFDLPVDVIGIDLVSKPENIALLLETDIKRELILGCLDARNTRIENEEEVLKLIQKVSRKISPDKIYISPSCGLEFLPHENALKKLRLLSSIASRFNS
ncbi:MAG: methylcobamide--CoM methyltransferase [candidate division Zixibacteria bacterium]|nr:methylcobamide--CoM methyltransferase [candidate division Zixibacteria bacterium]